VKPTARARPRSREQSRRATRARAPGGSSDDPDLASRPAGVCRSCGSPDLGTQALSDCKTCRARARKAKQRARLTADAIPDSYRNAVWKARVRGLIDACEALELLIWPSEQVLAMLRAAA
jgi:hypothetical protein